ncbi:MAG: hypothetical protein K8R36_09425 [Planctomycetales bacterium]|nr:hypothetical protein [Planctomycetales bacterium]
MRRNGGACSHCGAESWRLTTTYFDGQVLDDPLHLFFRWAFEVYVVEEIEDTTEIVTTNVPGADAYDIARLRWKYKGAACRYMEMRRELDAATERENQKARGAKNCLRCGFFFVPAVEKPWTSMGYCSKGCFGILEDKTDLPYLPVAPPAAIASKQNNRTISVVCKNGHAFEVAAMYAGTFRPCPICRQKTEVPSGA